MSGPERQGQSWLWKEVISLIRTLNLGGVTLEALAASHKRSTYAIKCQVDKLVERGMLDKSKLPKQTQPIIEEDIIMTTNLNTVTEYVNFLETRTFLCGKDIKSYTREEIYALINNYEQRAVKLSSLEHKPNMLKADIAKLNKDLVALISYLDKQEA
jgi:hypothetical protein